MSDNQSLIPTPVQNVYNAALGYIAPSIGFTNEIVNSVGANTININKGNPEQDKYSRHGHATPPIVFANPDGTTVTRILVEDGDTIKEVVELIGGGIVREETHRLSYIDTLELGQNPLAASQSYTLEKVLRYVKESGGNIELVTTGVELKRNRDDDPRSITNLYLISKDGARVHYSKLAAGEGWAAMANNNFRIPDNDPHASNTTIWNKAVEARMAGKGIYSPENRVIHNIAILKAKNDNMIPYTRNSKMGKFDWDLSKEENRSKVKIGDVWMEIPPTHLSINQLRSSYNIPLLGFEAKPITSSLTNRIVIKMNLVFSGAATVNTDLIRIMQQFIYTPINIIRSRDLFEKLASEATWLQTAYGNTGTYCVPVTMDQYTIYTLEGHPGAVGCSLQLSLFNFAAYFHADPNERLQYYKFNPEIYQIKDDRIIVKDDTQRSIFETTFDLEESIHPYNFLIEGKINGSARFGEETNKTGSESSVSISKINKIMTEKEFEVSSNRSRLSDNTSIESFVTDKNGKPVFIIDTAHSISLTYENRFAWQPLVGYSQPVAQYVGPGETRVSVNIKTNNQDNIAGYLKTYADLIDPSFYGFYDDRYYVDADLINFADCNIMSLQNVSVNNMESKPGWFDVNLMFNKSSYHSIVNAGNEPSSRDDYWGLGKMFNFLNIKGIKDRLAQVQLLANTNKATTALYRIPNPLGKDLDGLDLKFKSAVNQCLEFLDKNWTKLSPTKTAKGEYAKAAEGSQVDAALKSWGTSPIPTMKISQGKLKESEVKDAWVWKALEQRDAVAKAWGKVVERLDEGTPASDDLKTRLYYNAMSKETKDTIDKTIGEGSGGLAAVYDGRTIVIDFESNSGIAINTIKKAFTGAITGIEGSEDLSSLGLECEILDQGGNKRSFVVTRRQGKFYNRVPSEYEQDIAGVFKMIGKKEREEIERLLRGAELQNKPLAAHRYMEGIDNFICNNILGSRTMGYWFAFDRIKNLDKHLSSVLKKMEDVEDIVQDYPAWQNVFIKDSADGKLKEGLKSLIDPDNPYSIQKAAAYPEMKKRTDGYTDDGHPDGPPIKRDIIEVDDYRSIRNKDNKDIVFTVQSNQQYNRDYLGTGAKISEMTSAYIQNEENKEVYKLAAGVDGLFKDHWNANNGYKGIVPEGSDVLMARSGATPYDVSNGLVGDKNQITAPVAINQGAKKVQGTVISMQSSPSGVSYAADEKPAKETPAAVSTVSAIPKPTFGNYATARNSADLAGEGTPIKAEEKKARERALQEKTKSELLKSHMLSMLPTYGVQNAYPTFKMYIIHDNTSEYKYKALDSYWDYRLVQDMMIIRDKSNPSHILKARIIIDPRYSSTSVKVNQRADGRDQPLEGRDVNQEGEMDFRTIGGRDPIRQGMRISIKMGYHTDPRAMDTVFIGTITTLAGTQENGVYNIEARGDGRELLVPASIKDYSLEGDNFGDLISMMLRSNPNVVHFGKVYGSFLERFSREHQEWLKFLGQNFLSIPLFAGAAMAPLFLNPLTAGLGMTLMLGVGAGIGDLNTTSALIDKGLYNWHKADLGTFGGKALERFVGDLKSRLSGHIYNSDKAGYQAAKHMHDTMSFGNNPIDDNIFTYDIFAQGQGEDVNMKVNNQKSIWDVLVNIKRMYPGWALDVRPYGSRSTLYLGPPQGNYWRTDDPLLAMAPSLIQKDVIQGINNNKDYVKVRNDAVLKLVPRDRFNNVDLSSPGIMPGENVAPFIPFTKHHTVSSAEDIIHNGIRCTPERGWNSVVVTKENNTDPEEFLANEAIYKSALRRKVEIVDWTSNDRLRSQYAIGLLKEGVEKLYGGVLIIRGNPKIEPYDRIQIMDTINRMYGTIEVETVIHKYDAEMGFTTHIVPNMVCSINESSFLTSGDITKRVLVDKWKNMDMGDILEGALIAGSVFLPIAFWPMMVAMTSLEIAKMFFARTGEVSIPEMIHTSVSSEKTFKPSPLDDVGWAMRAKEFSWSLNIDLAQYGTAAAIKSIYKLSKEGKLDIKEASVKAMAKRANDVVTSVGSVKGETAKETAKNVLSKSKEGIAKLLGKKAPASVWTNPALDSPGAALADDVIDEKGILKRIGKHMPKGSTIGTIAVFAILEGLPLIFEAYAFKAATKNQIIAVRPLWHRDSLLMQGLEGYKNSDIWMHTKHVLMNAGEVVKEGFNAMKNFDQNIIHSSPFDDRISSIGTASASTINKTTKWGIPEFFGGRPRVIEAEYVTEDGAEKSGLKRYLTMRNAPYADSVIKWASQSASKHGIPLDLLMATIDTESGFDHTAFNQNPPSKIPSNLSEQQKRELKKKNAQNFDWGIAQINYYWHPEFYSKWNVDTKRPERYIQHSIDYCAELLSGAYKDAKKKYPNMSEKELYRRAYWFYNGGSIDAGLKNKDVVTHGNNFIGKLESIRTAVSRG